MLPLLALTTFPDQKEGPVGKGRALQRVEKSWRGSPCVVVPQTPLAGTQAPLPGRVFGQLEVCARQTSDTGNRWPSSSSRDSAHWVPASALETKAALPTTSLKSGAIPHRPFSPGANPASDPQGPKPAPLKQKQHTSDEMAASLSKHKDF